MRFKNHLKKFILAILIFSLVFDSLILISPQKALAFWGMGDITFDPIHAAISAGGWAAQKLWLTVTEEWRNVLRDAVVYSVLNIIADDVITWVQGEGMPLYVGNWENHLNDAYEKGKKEAIEEIPISYICPEFLDQLQENLQRDFGVRLSENPKPSTDGSIGKLKCTLDQGGSRSAPQNNIYGVENLIKDMAVARGNVKAQAAEDDAIAGRGYISSQSCLVQDDVGRCLKEQVCTPGATIADVISKTFSFNIEFMSNVQSPFSALTSALISRLIYQGICGSTPSSSTGAKTYVDPVYKEQMEQDLDNQKETIIDGYNDLLGQIEELLLIKKQSLVYALKLASSSCPIGNINIQEKITSLNKDIDDLADIRYQINNVLIPELGEINKENYIEKMLPAQQKYQSLMNRINREYYSGNAAEERDELQKFWINCPNKT